MPRETVIEQAMAFIAHEEYFEATCLQEKSELAMEDFFVQYPSLKPSTRADVITLKKSFVKFFNMDDDQQAKMIAGAPSREHAVLARFIKGLKEMAAREYKEVLSKDERGYLGSVDEFVLHKLTIEHGLKDVRKKKADFLASKLSMKEFAAGVMRNGSQISLRWDMDPHYATAEEVYKTADFEDAFRKFSLNKGEGDILATHYDLQSEETTFSVIKKKKEKK